MHMSKITMLVSALLLVNVVTMDQALGDEMTKRVQLDLVALGYDPGNIQGEATDQTVAAIAQFQAERDMPVTGEVSPLLAGVLTAAVNEQRNPPAVADTALAASDPAALQAAREACLQEKIAEAQAAGKKKRGLGRLMSAVTRTAVQVGSNDLAGIAADVYSANSTADDLAAAAKDLGLTEDEIEACENPV